MKGRNVDIARHHLGRITKQGARGGGVEGGCRGQVIITGEIWRLVFVRITRARTGDGSRILRNSIDMIFLHLYGICTSVVVVIFHLNMRAST